MKKLQVTVKPFQGTIPFRVLATWPCFCLKRCSEVNALNVIHEHMK